MTLEEKVDLLLKRQEQQDKALLNLSLLVMGMGDMSNDLAKMLSWAQMEYNLELLHASNILTEDNCTAPGLKVIQKQLKKYKEQEKDKMLKHFNQNKNIRQFIKMNLEAERFHANPIDKDPDENKEEFKAEVSA